MLYTTEIAEILAKSIESLDVKALEEGDTFRVVATDETKDRDGDIITLDGWDITNYLKNPVVLANHEYEIEMIVGKATKIYAENNQIIVEGVFSKTSEMGRLANALYNEGMLKTVSVGFIGKERQGEKITKKELLELSFVAVPSNPSAVSLDGKIYEEAVQKGLIVTEISREESFSDQFKSLISIEKGASPYDVYINDIFSSYFIYDVWIKDIGEKTYKRGYSSSNGVLTLIGEDTEVESRRIWSEKQLSDIKGELSEMKALIKTLADDKAEEKASEETRKAGQELAKALSSYLAQAKKSK